jgi:pyridoxamine 5'-phosphate oxidase family protein
MGTFTDAEVEYLNSQPLGRLATVGPDGRPHVTPVGGLLRPRDQDHRSRRSRRQRHGREREVPRRPAPPRRGVRRRRSRLHGPVDASLRGGPRAAEAHTDGGEAVGVRIGAGMPFDPAWIRISPRRIVAMGIEGGGPFELNARDTA